MDHGWHARSFLPSIMNASHEDTMIAAHADRPMDLLFEQTDESADSDSSVVARCRALFRSFGERVVSFDLSRQIYG